jgi:hypothetical protein
MNICIYPGERNADAGPPHTRARAASVRARLCVCDWAPTHPRQHRAPCAGVDHVQLRLAGVPVVGIQREHRRVEHRVTYLVVLCMRRLSGPGGARPQAGRARRVVDTAQAGVRSGAADARVCVRRHVGTRMRGCPRVQVQLLVAETGYMYICTCMYISLCMHYTHTHIYIGTYVLVREMRMRVHVDSPPAMHTCVRLRTPTMRPSPSRARVGASAGMYSQRTCHV